MRTGLRIKGLSSASYVSVSFYESDFDRWSNIFLKKLASCKSFSLVYSYWLKRRF